MYNYEPGKKLRNGAKIVGYLAHADTNKRVVFCEWPENDSVLKYVTWRVDEEGNAFWGHYFSDRELAKTDFVER